MTVLAQETEKCVAQSGPPVGLRIQQVTQGVQMAFGRREVPGIRRAEDGNQLWQPAHWVGARCSEFLKNSFHRS